MEGESFDVPARLALALVAERRAAADALAAARAEAERDRDRAIQSEAAAAQAAELLATERRAHLSRLRGLLARIAPGVSSEDEGEEQLLARIEVTCEVTATDKALLRACAPWGRA